MGKENRKFVNWTVEEGVATLVITNPPMNVLSGAVSDELRECCEELAADASVVAIVVTGAGERAFMAGADIREFPSFMGIPRVAKVAAERYHAAYNALDYLPKPTIAAVNGFALGGGLELALACDIRIAAENAKLGLPEITLGLIPGAGGTQRLPRLVGEGKAKELAFTGSQITAQEALQCGLVNKVVPQGEALKAAQEMAKVIASRTGSGLQILKKVIDRGTQVTLAEGLRLETEAFDDVFQTEDVREGVDAFLNKRPAKFKHR